MSLDGWGNDFRQNLIYLDSRTLIGSDVFIKLRCLDEAGDAKI